MVTVAISGPYGLGSTSQIDDFVTASLGGAAGDAIGTYQDSTNGGGPGKVYIICSKA